MANEDPRELIDDGVLTDEREQLLHGIGKLYSV